MTTGLKFAQRVFNERASQDNPRRSGYFVKKVRRTGKLNPGIYAEMTDGKGDFWTAPIAYVRPEVD